jgi:hypothetical protein
MDWKSRGAYYGCPGYGRQRDDPLYCPKGQFVMEKNALRLLREHAVPVLFRMWRR